MNGTRRTSQRSPVQYAIRNSMIESVLPTLWILRCFLAKQRRHFVFQEFYKSLQNGSPRGEIYCGEPLIKFLWDAQSIESAPYCDLCVLLCMTAS
jgi:hypothetical protein